MSECTIYIDEAGDLGFGRGTQWFVLSGVIVDKADEPEIRGTISRIKTTLNVNEIHLRKIQDYYKRSFIVRELNDMPYTYINVLVDTQKFDSSKIPTPMIAYNYVCKYLLQWASKFLEISGKTGDIVLSSRGTSRDGELIQYITDKLLPYPNNGINSAVIKNISARTAATWDLLQLADVCATTMFLTYEVNSLGFCTPCWSMTMRDHLYRRNEKIIGYGIKFFTDEMKPDISELRKKRVCAKKERTPGATTT